MRSPSELLGLDIDQAGNDGIAFRGRGVSRINFDQRDFEYWDWPWRSARAQRAPPKPPPMTYDGGASALREQGRLKRSSRGAQPRLP